MCNNSHRQLTQIVRKVLVYLEGYRNQLPFVIHTHTYTDTHTHTHTAEGLLICSLAWSFRGFPGGASGKEPACQCTRQKRHRFDSWVRKIPPEEGTASPSSVLTWETTWTEEPGSLQSMGSQRIRHDWSDLALVHMKLQMNLQLFYSPWEPLWVSLTLGPSVYIYLHDKSLWFLWDPSSLRSEAAQVNTGFIPSPWVSISCL